MKRKEFLKKGITASLAAGLISGCNSTESGSGDSVIASGKKYYWKMVTTWPPNFPVLGESAIMFADLVKKMSAGRLNIKVYGSGELVPGLEAFDTVASGTVEMGSGAAYYWAGKSVATQFFAAVPFGMNAQQLTSWMISGDGLKLWKECYARFDMVPFLAGNTGVQMGGWFNREINSINDLKGLKMRIPGLAGKALEKAGGAAVLVAGGEIYTSLERGVIDATEWVGPYHDYKMGFHKIAKYYYTPGWHEPGTQLEFFCNKTKFDKLPNDLQAIMEAASMQVHTWVLSEFEAKNAVFLQKIKKENKVKIKQFPQSVLDQLRTYNKEAVNELISKDAFARKVYDNYSAFVKNIKEWSELTEKVYYEKIQL